MLDIFITFFVSLLLSYSLITLLSKLFIKLDIVDNPKKYNKKRKPIPYSMWIIFFLVFFIVSYFFVEHTYKLYLLWIFWAIITAISFVDDRLNVSAKIRLVIQILIWAIIWITSIKIWYISNIFGWIINLETYHFEILNYTIYIIPLIFTILWYVFIFNALNWTDWIEWNTSWLWVISFFILFLLWVILFNRDNYEWWIQNAKFIMQLAIILVWALIPFWFFDVREKILMWDTWTMFLWFMLASLAIISGWKIATVLVVFWIYTVDAIYVVLKRMYNKKSPLKWDFTHLHHRLLNIWLSKNQVLGTIFSLSFFFWVTALFLNRTWKIIVFVIIIFVVIFINEIVKLWLKKYALKKNKK
jgi:UDP-GlcNAc:undecaprenyl-phosphate GlcNAc-1-phosphate transferase